MNTFIFKIRFIKKLKIFEVVSVILNLLYTMFIYMQINVLSDFFNKKLGNFEYMSECIFIFIKKKKKLSPSYTTLRKHLSITQDTCLFGLSNFVELHL